MGHSRIDIDSDIRRARALPAGVYRDPELSRLQAERVFTRSWQPVVEWDPSGPRGFALPFTLLPECLDEPLVLVTDASGETRCLSNVCTHRGNLVVLETGPIQGLRCRYHGRRFDLDGCFRSMPEFEETHDFPTPADDLPGVATASWGPLQMVGLDPPPIEKLLEPVTRRVGSFPIESLRLDPDASRDYEVNANWALYCDNYLEGFHIPFVHAGLNQVLEYDGYRTETFAHGSLQIGLAADGKSSFTLPAEHPDFGQRVAAYYFWLFPNLMLNFYPWGLSLNVVQPRGVDRTRVLFRSYVWDPSRRGEGAGADLHQVELEDEAVVEDVQRGVRSRLYDRGRYSPTQEVGVHHFHRLLAGAMNGEV